jgi:hypothetical protein
VLESCGGPPPESVECRRLGRKVGRIGGVNDDDAGRPNNAKRLFKDLI